MRSSKGRQNPSCEEEARQNPSYEEEARKNPSYKEEARKSPRYEEARDKEEVEGTGSEHRRDRQQEARRAIRLTEAPVNSCNAIPHNDGKRAQKDSGKETPMDGADTSCVASVIGEDDDDDSSSSSSSYDDSPDFSNDTLVATNDALVATLTDQTTDEEDALATSLLAAHQEQRENLKGLTGSAKNLGKRQRREIPEWHKASQRSEWDIDDAHRPPSQKAGHNSLYCYASSLNHPWESLGNRKRRESGTQDHLPQEGGAKLPLGA